MEGKKQQSVSSPAVDLVLKIRLIVLQAFFLQLVCPRRKGTCNNRAQKLKEGYDVVIMSDQEHGPCMLKMQRLW
eukprot:1142471-Pelagomonas_calceolata.AAC.11